MGHPKSKMKKETKVAPKVNIDSPTTINTSSGFHLLEFHGPRVSNIVILRSCACLTAVGVVFLYRHVSKKRQIKEARLMETARTDPELGMLPPTHRIQMNPQWSQGCPRPGTAYHAGGSPPPTTRYHSFWLWPDGTRSRSSNVGATCMTELQVDNMASFPRHATTHALGDHRKAANKRAANELDAIIMASPGRPRN